MPQHQGLGDIAADREAEKIDLRQAKGVNEGGGIIRHRFDVVWSLSAGVGHTGVVEQDHLAGATMAARNPLRTGDRHTTPFASTNLVGTLTWVSVIQRLLFVARDQTKALEVLRTKSKRPRNATSGVALRELLLGPAGIQNVALGSSLSGRPFATYGRFQPRGDAGGGVAVKSSVEVLSHEADVRRGEHIA